MAEGRKAVNVARNPTVRDDSRIRDVLGAQGQLSAAAQAEVPFQTGLAQVIWLAVAIGTHVRHTKRVTLFVISEVC